MVVYVESVKTRSGFTLGFSSNSLYKYKKPREDIPILYSAGKQNHKFIASGNFETGE